MPKGIPICPTKLPNQLLFIVYKRLTQNEHMCCAIMQTNLSDKYIPIVWKS